MTKHLLEEGGTRFACAPQSAPEELHGVFLQVVRARLSVGVRGGPPPPCRRLTPLNGESLTGQTSNYFQAWQVRCVWMFFSSGEACDAVSCVSRASLGQVKCIGGEEDYEIYEPKPTCKQMLMVPQEQAVPVANLRLKESFRNWNPEIKCLMQEAGRNHLSNATGMRTSLEGMPAQVTSLQPELYEALCMLHSGTVSGPACLLVRH